MPALEWPQLEAAVASMTKAEKLRLLEIVASQLGQDEAFVAKRRSIDDFDTELDKIAQPAPPLPSDFSRADIYRDHD
jgi:hypothetical protein